MAVSQNEELLKCFIIKPQIKKTINMINKINVAIDIKTEMDQSFKFFGFVTQQVQNGRQSENASLAPGFNGRKKWKISKKNSQGTFVPTQNRLFGSDYFVQEIRGRIPTISRWLFIEMYKVIRENLDTNLKPCSIGMDKRSKLFSHREELF